jgi:hypothetical protein
MSYILRVRDKDGKMIDIPALRGEKGEKGDKGEAPDTYSKAEVDELIAAQAKALQDYKDEVNSLFEALDYRFWRNEE